MKNEQLRTENCFPILDLLHRQQRSIVTTIRVNGAGDHAGESVSQFRILRDQTFHHRNIVLISLRGVGNIRRLILHDQIQIIAHHLRKNRGQLVGCCCGGGSGGGRRKFDGLALGRKICRLQLLRLVVKLVGSCGAHKRQRRNQRDRLEIIKPCVVQLAFALEFAGVRGEPVAVMGAGLCGFDVESAEFPVRRLLLQDQRNRVCAFGRRRVQDDNAILAGRKIVQRKNSAVTGLAFAPENPAEKLRASNGRRPFRLQQKRRTSAGFGTGKGSLVVFDGGLNARKIGGQAGDSTLTERRRIAFGNEIEVAQASGSKSGARGVVHVAGGGTSLRQDTRRRKCQQSQRGTAQRQAPAPKRKGPAGQKATFQEAAYV